MARMKAEITKKSPRMIKMIHVRVSNPYVTVIRHTKNHHYANN